MPEVTVVGWEALANLARDLKVAGDAGLRKELFRAIQRAGKPLKQAARDAAEEELPKEGGLSTRVAGSKFSTRTRAGRNPSVRIVGAGDLDLAALDRGRLRHPVYGHRDRWVTQVIPPHWFTDAMERQAPQAREEIVKAIDEVAAKLGGNL